MIYRSKIQEKLTNTWPDTDPEVSILNQLGKLPSNLQPLTFAVPIFVILKVPANCGQSVKPILCSNIISTGSKLIVAVFSSGANRQIFLPSIPSLPTGLPFPPFPPLPGRQPSPPEPPLPPVSSNISPFSPFLSPPIPPSPEIAFAFPPLPPEPPASFGLQLLPLPPLAAII